MRQHYASRIAPLQSQVTDLIEPMARMEAEFQAMGVAVSYRAVGRAGALTLRAQELPTLADVAHRMHNPTGGGGLGDTAFNYIPLELAKGVLGLAQKGLGQTVVRGVTASRTTNVAGGVVDDLVIDSYATLSRRADLPGQAHHLNQTAAYRDVILTSQGASIKLRGNILTDAGAPHTRAHQSLERFWNKYRGTDIVPTNLEYTRALQQSLRSAGLPEAQVQQAVRAAIRERVGAGALGGRPVPRMPGPIRNLAD